LEGRPVVPGAGAQRAGGRAFLVRVLQADGPGIFAAGRARYPAATPAGIGALGGGASHSLALDTIAPITE
jgi:hypothetical protein